MANTGQAYGIDLEIRDQNGILLTTLLNVDVNIDAQTLSELSGGLLTVSQAQQAIDSRFTDDLVNCKPCLDPLAANYFYVEGVKDLQNSENTFGQLNNALVCIEGIKY